MPYRLSGWNMILPFRLESLGFLSVALDGWFQEIRIGIEAMAEDTEYVKRRVVLHK